MTNIQWYPGHMTKAKRQMSESMKLVDMVIEIRDARVPHASANPMIDQMTNQKPRLIILSKKDKADDVQTEKWIQKLSGDNCVAIAIDATHDNFNKQVVNACQLLMKEKRDKQIKKGIRPRAIRAMVVGIPNVGKSTFINHLAKKKIAKTADHPGVTKALQWIKLNNDVELLDTPGILWPKFEDEHVAKCLAITGAINDQILDLLDIAVFGITQLNTYYPLMLTNHYHIEQADDPYQIIKEIGIARKLIKKDNEVDTDRTVIFLIKELRDNKVGKITWEQA